MTVPKEVSASQANPIDASPPPDYRSIRSVQEIVLLDQETLYCEVHRRLESAPTKETGWLVDLLRRPDAILRLESIGFEAPLAAIYAHVELSAVDEET